MENKNDILVEVKGLSKKFSRSLKKSLWYGLKDIGSEMFGGNGTRSSLRSEEFWAVKDVNFTLRRGECLGLIGRNGAGKSTLLKMLNGLIRPDEGSITMRGKVGALIELGAGFNPLLSGRENIYVNAQLYGFSKEYVDKKLSAIIDFAEIGEFIDAPIQNYSSGMKVRLGFAVAAQMEPDILLLDEVLAVGDAGFVLKCFNVIDNLFEKTAVIFVSHAMPMVSRICTNIMLLEKGQSKFFGNDVSKGIDMYYSGFGNSIGNSVQYNRENDAQLLEIIFIGSDESNVNDGTTLYCIDRLQDLKINLVFKVKNEFKTPSPSVIILDKEQRPVGICQHIEGVNEKNILKEENGYIYFNTILTMPRINLSKGIYLVSFALTEKIDSKPLLRLHAIKKFQVSSKRHVWPPIEFEAIWD